VIFTEVDKSQKSVLKNLQFTAVNTVKVGTKK
jgi:hypothetical protein